MRKAKYAVELTEAERAQLRTLVGRGRAPARMVTRARILLKANQGEGGAAWSDAAIAGALEVHPNDGCWSSSWAADSVPLALPTHDRLNVRGPLTILALYHT